MDFGQLQREGIWKIIDGVLYCRCQRKKGKSVFVCSGAEKQKSWLSDQSFAKSSALRWSILPITDMNCSHFLLTEQCRSLHKMRKKLEIESKELTIYYDMQCPYIDQKIGIVKQYCEMNDVPLSLILVDTLQKAKELPCVFNNWAVFYKGKFETVNLIQDVTHLREYLRNESI